MGYATTAEILASNHFPSDTQLAINDTVGDTTSTTYEKGIALTLIRDIYSASRFRFKFSLCTTVNPILSYGKIYKNDVAVGTEQTNANLAWSEKTEDIDTDLVRGDEIAVYFKTAGGPAHAKIKDLKICGYASDFITSYP